MANTQSPAREKNLETGTVRLNVNLNAETAAVLKQLTEERGISFTEAVRRAISVYNYIDGEARSGRRIQTTDANHSDVREFVLM